MARLRNEDPSSTKLQRLEREAARLRALLGLPDQGKEMAPEASARAPRDFSQPRPSPSASAASGAARSKAASDAFQRKVEAMTKAKDFAVKDLGMRTDEAIRWTMDCFQDVRDLGEIDRRVENARVLHQWAKDPRSKGGLGFSGTQAVNEALVKERYAWERNWTKAELESFLAAQRKSISEEYEAIRKFQEACTARYRQF